MSAGWDIGAVVAALALGTTISSGLFAVAMKIGRMTAVMEGAIGAISKLDQKLDAERGERIAADQRINDRIDDSMMDRMEH